MTYSSKEGHDPIDVKIVDGTIWLSLTQLEKLFERDKSVISRHLRNIFREEELDKQATVAKFATVQFEGERQVNRTIEFYNLDAILAVGYRVNSQQGTRFRQWATQQLKEILNPQNNKKPSHMRGKEALHPLYDFAKLLPEEINEEIQQAFIRTAQTLHNRALSGDQETDILFLIRGYAPTWSLLFQYDDGEFPTPQDPVPSQAILSYEEVLTAIHDLKTQLFRDKEATVLFGQERGGQLKGILGNVEQTFEGQPLYVSREEKAAHLLYFVIKDHPFSDGNKRIGVFLFLVYLKKQGFSLESLSNQTLVALALLIAESDPSSKEIMIKLIINLLLF